MRVWAFALTLILVFAGLPGLAQDKPVLNLKDKVSEQEANRILEEGGKAGGEGVFFFGFDLRGSPLEDARQYLPFLDYLRRATGYEFKLRFTPKGSSTIDDLGTGKVDFAAVGAVSYIHAHEKYGTVSLVRGINLEGKSEYTSAIVVSPESPIRSVKDLRGKRFAFGSVSSTQGHLIPRIELVEHGIGLDDFAAYDYTGSHVECANAVVRKTADACGMQDTMALSMAKQGLLRLLHTSRHYPSSGIAAYKGVPSDALKAVKQALLAFDPTGRDWAGLYNWHQTEMPLGFKASDQADYAILRKWLIHFEMLNAGSGGKTLE